jgi:hypothetical protein
MAVEVFEKPKSRQVTVDYKTPSETRAYGAYGDEDVTDVLTALASFAPAFVTIPDAGTGAAIALLPRQITSNEYAPGFWDLTIRYEGEAADAFTPGSAASTGASTSSDKWTLTLNFNTQNIKQHLAIADVRAYNAVATVSGSVNTAASAATTAADAVFTAADLIGEDSTARAQAVAANNAATIAANVALVDATVKTETLEAVLQTANIVNLLDDIVTAAYLCGSSTRDAATSANAGDAASALAYKTVAEAQAVIVAGHLATVSGYETAARSASDDATAAIPGVDPGGVSAAAAAAADTCADEAADLETLVIALSAAATAAGTAADAASDAVAADTAPGGAIPDFHRLIGVTDSGVEGIDVEKGACEITIEKKWDKAILPSTYLQTLANYNDQTPVNDAAYTINYLGQSIVCARGTLRLRSVSVTTDSGKSLTINYVFSYRRNLTAADNFTIGNSAPIVMEGHHGFWIRTKKEVSNSVTVEVPKSVHIVQIYPYKPFGVLAI